MLSVLNNRKPIYNKSLMDYCRKSTEESIKKMILEKEKEKDKYFLKHKIELNLNNSQALSNNKNAFVYLTILSLSSFIYFFLNIRK